MSLLKSRLLPVSGTLFAVSLLAAAIAQAADGSIEQVEVTGIPLKSQGVTGDAAAVLRHQGVNFSSAGGISSLPILRGLNDDRIKLVIDGAETTSACANHMNPALSYMDASRIHAVEVMAGITPVSVGGDNIAGTIVLTSEAPRFAQSAGDVLTEGSAAYFYRSNNHNQGVALNATAASDILSLTYSGSRDKADSYRDGNGDKVLDTLYRSESHSLTLGMRGEDQLLTVKLGHQEVPYQGFPNQYMDMVGNVSNSVNVQYVQDFNWGQLDTGVTWQDVNHEMGFFTDEKPGTMPMLTEGRDIGYHIAAELPLSKTSTLRVGHEYHQFTLDDWWPAVDGSMMMEPNDFININNGERSRSAVYVESENTLNEKWQTLIGTRYEYVVTDSDDVQPYSTMGGMMNVDAAAAVAFNSRNHRRVDDNVDLTAVARYLASANTTLEFGYARKTRSPSLYERYSWGRNTMAMTMIGWYGDANAYVGDIDLQPEVAHTLSSTLKWASADTEVSVTPYYTYVDDFIDAENIGTFNPRMAMQVTRPCLQLVNLDANLYGVDAKGRTKLAEGDKGTLQLSSSLNYTRGERHHGGDDLYHIMPLQIKVALEHNVNDWANTLEVEWVDEKNHVDPIRQEGATAAYTLVNLSTQYQWQQVSLSLAVRNLFDRNYDLPLGGVYLSGWSAGDHSEPFTDLPGQGRSVDVGVKYSF